jgi:hypothetical protein
MKTVSHWDALREYGIDVLISEPQYVLCHTAMCFPTGA